jgi:transcriptional regulator with XRE-family HTH domain
MATAVNPLPLPEGIGPRLQYVRQILRGWSRKRLGDRLNEIGCPMPLHTIKRLESSFRAPTLGELLVLATALDVSVSQLGADEENYPELKVFRDLDELVRHIRCSAKRAPHLRVVPSPIP